MEVLTKQELHSSLQNTVNAIAAKTITRQDMANAIQSISQRVCTRQDIQIIIDASRDRFAEKVILTVREQQYFNKQLITQLENLNRRLAQMEQKLDSAQATIKTVQDETEAAMNFAYIAPNKSRFGQVFG